LTFVVFSMEFIRVEFELENCHTNNILNTCVEKTPKSVCECAGVTCVMCTKIYEKYKQPIDWRRITERKTFKTVDIFKLERNPRLFDDVNTIVN